jgi:hypothetical protein
MFEEQEVTVDKALIIKGVVIKAAIKGSKDKIFKGTKAEIKEYLTKELNIVEYPKDGIIQEPGNYELQDTKIDQQLNSDISNPTQIFYMKARLDEYKLIIMTVVSIPVYIKE